MVKIDEKYEIYFFLTNILQDSIYQQKSHIYVFANDEQIQLNTILSNIKCNVGKISRNDILYIWKQQKELHELKKDDINYPKSLQEWKEKLTLLSLLHNSYIIPQDTCVKKVSYVRIFYDSIIFCTIINIYIYITGRRANKDSRRIENASNKTRVDIIAT